jgi:hypothetical protein
MDHLALVVWLGDKLALLLMLLPVSLVRCSLFRRLTRMMSRDFVRGFHCFHATGFPHEVLAYSVVLRLCITLLCSCRNIMLAVLADSCLLLVSPFPIAGASFADAGRIDTPLRLPS